MLSSRFKQQGPSRWRMLCREPQCSGVLGWVDTNGDAWQVFIPAGFAERRPGLWTQTRHAARSPRGEPRRPKRYAGDGWDRGLRVYDAADATAISAIHTARKRVEHYIAADDPLVRQALKLSAGDSDIAIQVLSQQVAKMQNGDSRRLGLVAVLDCMETEKRAAVLSRHGLDGRVISAPRLLSSYDPAGSPHVIVCPRCGRGTQVAIERLRREVQSQRQRASS